MHVHNKLVETPPLEHGKQWGELCQMLLDSIGLFLSKYESSDLLDSWVISGINLSIMVMIE